MSFEDEDLDEFVFGGTNLSSTDKQILSTLTVPIPVNEAKRLAILRDTGLLGSPQNDPTFNRFTSLAKRIFNFPLVSIEFADVGEIWIKSCVGFEAVKFERNNSICTYAIMPDSPEVYVVPDTFQDPNFSTQAFVKGPPYVRFCAAAAIIVDEVRLGTLSVMDRVRREEFNIANKANLLDLAAAISVMVSDIREKNILKKHEAQYSSKQTEMNAHLVKLSNPLASISLLSSMIKSNIPPTTSIVSAQRRASKQNINVADNNYESNDSLSFLINEIKKAEKTVDAAFQSMGTLSQDNMPPLVKDSLAVASDIMLTGENFSMLQLVNIMMKIFRKLPSDFQIEWIVDTTYLGLGAQRSYIEAVKFILLHFLRKLMNVSQSIKVKIGFEPTHPVKKKSSEKSNNNATEVQNPLELSSQNDYSANNNTGFLTIDIITTIIVDTNPNPLSPTIPMLIKQASTDSLDSVRRGRGERETIGRSATRSQPRTPGSSAGGIHSRYNQGKENLFVAHNLQKELNTLCNLCNSIEYNICKSEDFVEENVLMMEFFVPCVIVPELQLLQQPQSRNRTTSISSMKGGSPAIESSTGPTAYTVTNNEPMLMRTPSLFMGEDDSEKPPLHHLEENEEETVKSGCGSDVVGIGTGNANGPVNAPSSRGSRLKAYSSVYNGQQQFDSQKKNLSTRNKNIFNRTSQRGGGSGGGGGGSDRTNVDNDNSTSLSNQDPNATTLQRPQFSRQFSNDTELGMEELLFSLGDPFESRNGNSGGREDNDDDDDDDDKTIDTVDKSNLLRRPPSQRVLSVLIVDDSMMIQKVMKSTLSTQGCRISCANNGSEALNMLKQMKFDITFMDFLMPVMLGLDCLRNLKEWREDNMDLSDDMLIIGMSSNPTQQEKDEASENGMHIFVPKPVDPNLIRIILTAMKSTDTLKAAIQEIKLEMDLNADKKRKDSTPGNKLTTGYVHSIYNRGGGGVGVGGGGGGGTNSVMLPHRNSLDSTVSAATNLSLNYTRFTFETDNNKKAVSTGHPTLYPAPSHNLMMMESNNDQNNISRQYLDAEESNKKKSTEKPKFRLKWWQSLLRPGKKYDEAKVSPK